jgi:poly(A) polymerase
LAEYQRPGVANNVKTSCLKKSRILHAVHRLSPGEAYLVGGAVRDLLLGRPLGKDFDFVMKGEVSGLAKAVARETKGHAFPLDEALGTWRVVLKKRKGRAELDFSRMQGKDIIEDLRQRDFTVNSIALGLEEMFSREAPRFIDPLRGISDLEWRILRANSEESLRHDPLRMLRAFRFASSLNFSVEGETLGLIRRNKDLIRRSAWERIRSEFFTALRGNQAGLFLRQLDEVGLLGEIFPEIQGWIGLMLGPPGNCSLLEHAFRTVEAGEFILAHAGELYPPLGSTMKDYSSQTVEEGISRKALIKFSAFLHDSGKARTMTRGQEDPGPRFPDHDLEGQKINIAIARRMKLSRRSTRIISDLTRHHMRIHSLSRGKEITPRAKYRFFLDLGKEGIDLVLLALSNAMASKDSEFLWPLRSDSPPDLLKIKEVGEELLRYYWGEFAPQRPNPLLNGKEIMEALRIPPGKAVGGLLRKLREGEAAGTIQTREEALEFLKNIDRSAQFG